MYTLFETLLWKNKMRQKCNFCYVHSLNLNLNLPKPEHVQNVPRLPQYTPNNDDEQSDILSGLLLMECHRSSDCGFVAYTVFFKVPHR
ncbi:hypothetical protein C0J52_05353 [Blattella germanica]|nr:hypothetical protein C0J52_05353 [Blattella germanica]